MAIKDYARSLEWSPGGKCTYRVIKTRKCIGQPGYSGGCPGRYLDDYGTHASCNQCHGNGKVNYFKYIRVPEFDAPRPPKNWIPDWVEE